MARFIKVFGIILLSVALTSSFGQGKRRALLVEFYSGNFKADADTSLFVDVPAQLSANDVRAFYSVINKADYKPVIDSLLAYKNSHQLNDWLYYQLVRKTAQQISPKAENYGRYTLYKWFLLAKSGYDARLAITPDKKVIFYVYNDEDITDIPFFMVDGKKFMCLNYHDYAKADLNQDPPLPVDVTVPGATGAFSYIVTRMPDFKAENYIEKKLQFTYGHKVYHFTVKLNPDIEKIFTNYPGVDFGSYFNIPLSKETYSSLIPVLKKNIAGMTQKKGVDYLMRFTRYAFLYEDDEENYGKEKRLSPEGTLFAKYSDCDDRAALFFYLVKEIYDLPMIALLYPTHITIGVEFDKPVGTPIVYNGKVYSVCEPTLQPEDLQIGQVSAKLKDMAYQVVYSYNPEYR
ncbi:hypothetical protein DJ568_06945 [Mucilaginibacter hurinus]|uniref:Transglutaminase-like domain-containing protein n=1 Tax=Mucilaginibacter hurinus TaxID=2201324 RepID=A0A367GQ92_9SPHI|nr:hypothetical protein [Mucilaginibacter hurinus]RCH55619.1 hypothetical protein DJ568_06945 [Mucilaginibacter hurinus]